MMGWHQIFTTLWLMRYTGVSMSIIHVLSICAICGVKQCEPGLRDVCWLIVGIEQETLYVCQ
jgi:hypothetical protein